MSQVTNESPSQEALPPLVNPGIEYPEQETGAVTPPPNIVLSINTSLHLTSNVGNPPK